MTLRQSIRSSSKWLVSTNLSNQFMQFVFGIILARLLVPADFGMVVTIQIFTGFVGLIASGGMGQALIQAKKVDDIDFQVVFTIQLAIGLVIYTTFFLMAPWFVDWFNDPLYQDLLRISAISFLLRPFIQLHTIWLQREMQFKRMATRTLIGSLVGGGISILMASTGFGVWSLILGGLFGNLLTIPLLFRLTPLKPYLNFRLDIARRHSSFGIKFTLNDLISYLRRQTSNFIISRLAGPSMVGLFNKGDSLAKLPFTVISTPIYQPVFRIMSASQDNPDKIKYLFYKMISLLMLYTLPLYAGMWWLAEPFITVVYGEHWRASAVPLEILAPLGLLYCIGHPCGAVLAAKNRLGGEIVVQIVTWMIVALGTYFGLQWGLTGVAAGIVLSQIYSTVHMYLLAIQCIPARLVDLLHALGPSLLLNTIMLGALIISDVLFLSDYRQESPSIYLLTSIGIAGLAFSLAFLFLPIPAIAEESQRWKKFLRLSR